MLNQAIGSHETFLRSSVREEQTRRLDFQALRAPRMGAGAPLGPRRGRGVSGAGPLQGGRHFKRTLGRLCPWVGSRFQPTDCQRCQDSVRKAGDNEAPKGSREVGSGTAGRECEGGTTHPAGLRKGAQTPRAPHFSQGPHGEGRDLPSTPRALGKGSDGRG